MEKQNYGFATAISMVVGIVIGSGIFFKADDILQAVNGNVMLGVLGFLLVGVGVLFGTLTVAYYTSKDTENIGLIGYSRMALGDKFAFVVGWFAIVCYFPAFTMILAMVASIYLGVLIGVDSQLFITLATVVFLVASFTINIKSPETGGKVQVIFTIAKIIPLIVIGLAGTLFFTSADSLSTVATNTLEGGKPLSALIAIAFAFDGWIVATNISSEVKDSEKNLPRALAFGSIGIVLIYCIYFFGVTQIVGPQEIVALGDAHTEVAAQAVVGPIGAKLITLFVVISVYGGLNGMTLAYLRLPKLMLNADLMKNKFGPDERSIERGSILFCIAVVGFYFVFQQLLDYGVIFTNLDSPFDLSSLPIVINYIFYLVLFVVVNKLVSNEAGKTRVYYLLISFVAGFTALVVIYGTMQVNGLLYIIFSLLVTVIGIPMYKSSRA